MVEKTPLLIYNARVRGRKFRRLRTPYAVGSVQQVFIVVGKVKVDSYGAALFSRRPINEPVMVSPVHDTTSCTTYLSYFHVVSFTCCADRLVGRGQ